MTTEACFIGINWQKDTDSFWVNTQLVGEVGVQNRLHKCLHITLQCIKCSVGQRHSFCVNHLSNYHLRINGEGKSIWTFNTYFLNIFSLVFFQSLCIYLGKDLLPKSDLLTRFCSHLLICHYSIKICFIYLMEDQGPSVQSSNPQWTVRKFNRPVASRYTQIHAHTTPIPTHPTPHTQL